MTTGDVTYPNVDGTTGQVLTTDGAGAAAWTDAPAGGADTDWTESGNYVYNENDSVGIGTATPAAKLDLTADALINGLTVGRGGGNISANTANGWNGLYENTTGDYNTANGSSALFSNTEGNNNTANGSSALFSNTTGDHNTANGSWALYYNTTGSWNTANGHQALHFNTTGDYNTANGH